MGVLRNILSIMMVMKRELLSKVNKRFKRKLIRYIVSVFSTLKNRRKDRKKSRMGMMRATQITPRLSRKPRIFAFRGGRTRTQIRNSIQIAKGYCVSNLEQ